MPEKAIELKRIQILRHSSLVEPCFGVTIEACVKNSCNCCNLIAIRHVISKAISLSVLQACLIGTTHGKQHRIK